MTLERRFQQKRGMLVVAIMLKKVLLDSANGTLPSNFELPDETQSNYSCYLILCREDILYPEVS